ncbi:MAG: hypothetical protein ACKO8K_03385 [Candidatus Limnocylindrus sp.]
MYVAYMPSQLLLLFLKHAFAHLASNALSEALTSAARGVTPRRGEITLRYPSPPRGVDGRGV